MKDTTRIRRGRGNCGQDVLYERIILTMIIIMMMVVVMIILQY